MKIFQRTGKPTEATAIQRPQIAARDRTDAKRQEDDVTLWSDYRSFLRAKRTLLEQRIAEGRGAFERSAQIEEEAARAQAALDRIPAATRELFEAVLETRRQETQSTLTAAQRGRRADPDEVDRQVLGELLAEAEGEVESEQTPKGYGWFPRGTPSDIRWYALEVSELLAQPTVANYSIVTEKDDARVALRKIGIAVVLGILTLTVWYWSISRAPAAREQTAIAPLASIGSSAAAGASAPVLMDIQTIQQVIATTKDGQQQLIVGSTTSASWPATTQEVPAYWQRNAFAPLKLCVDSNILEGMTSLRILGGGSWPDRIYTISATEPRLPDLVMESCRGSAKRYGTLQQLAPAASYDVGASVTLGKAEESIIVRSIAIVGPGQDPTMPAGQGRIIVTVQARPDLDWPAYAPTLIMPSGQGSLPAETIANSEGAELRYLVPLLSDSTPLAWDVTEPMSKQTARWRITLAPPPSRVEVLRRALEVRDLQVREQDGALAVTFVLVNLGDTPLHLVRSDIVVAQRDRQITTPDIGALASPLALDERREVTLSLPTGEFTLSIGPYRYRISR